MVNVARFVSILMRRAFEDAHGNKYNIWKRVKNCNTDFTVYKFHSSCSKLYIGSNITAFYYQFKNYKSRFRKVSKLGKPPKLIRTLSFAL